jgi:hypothetical protein
MATREAIAKMRGKVNEGTAWVVDASALDTDGFDRAIQILNQGGPMKIEAIDLEKQSLEHAAADQES